MITKREVAEGQPKVVPYLKVRSCECAALECVKCPARGAKLRIVGAKAQQLAGMKGERLTIKGTWSPALEIEVHSFTNEHLKRKTG